MPTGLIDDVAAALADVTQRMITRQLDLEIREAVVSLIAVAVMNVNAARDFNAGLMEYVAMFERVTV